MTIIATRRSGGKNLPAKSAESTSADDSRLELETELVNKTETKRSASRIVPPAPDLTTEQREEIIAKHAGKGGRSRKGGPRMKQTTLQLDIVNKGRFDKTEPTVYKGEDLDLPTYIRRGVALN